MLKSNRLKIFLKMFITKINQILIIMIIKLLIYYLFLDLNKNKFLGYKYKFEIIIEKDRYTDSFLNEVNDKNQKIINEKINKRKFRIRV